MKCTAFALLASSAAALEVSYSQPTQALNIDSEVQMGMDHCPQPAPNCLPFGGDIWGSCKNNWDSCTTTCRGWAPKVHTTEVTCMKQDTCEDVPTWARGAVCDCDASKIQVKHGMLDDKHCEELYIPTESFDRFWAADGYKYPTYTDGLCPAPYSTSDDTTVDGDFAEVTHLKRGMGAAAATISVSSSCGGDFTWKAGTPVKGKTVDIVGTGKVSNVKSGTYTVKADFGSINLANIGANLDAPTSKDIVVLFTNFGTLKVQPFSLPADGEQTVTITMPVPNINGKVTGSSVGFATGAPDPIWCLQLTMDL